MVQLRADCYNTVFGPDIETDIFMDLAFWGYDARWIVAQLAKRIDINQYLSGVDPVCWLRPDSKLYKKPPTFVCYWLRSVYPSRRHYGIY